MNPRSPKALAFVTALIVSAVLLLGLGALAFSGLLTVELWLLAAMYPALVIVTYLIFLVAIDRFLYHKLRLIYKTIHRHKRGANPPLSLNMGSDVLEQVDREVADWADKQNEEIRALKDQEEYRRAFIGNVAHELKTPLFTVQGYILTLLEGGLEDPNINKKYLRRADKSLQRLINITDDLDEITKFESGRLQLHTERMDVVELAQEVVDSLELQASESEITVSLKKDYEPFWVSADKERIRQVLTNLIVNSIKYGREGGATEIRFYDMDEYILTEVADNGPGIEEKHLPRLFERFYRVEESRSRDKGGSGLGLAIVKHIVDAHDQTINARSTAGVGSTFSFTLEKSR